VWGARHGERGGQKAGHLSAIVAIVIQLHSDFVMQRTVFFTCFFYFSHSSPKAVE
jgi:hypothetical protein